MPSHEWRVHDGSRKQKWQIPILHEDQAIIALHKPAGLPVIPERWHPDWPCLKSIAAQQLGAKIWVVHRLDAGTSGVVVLAKSAEAHGFLCDQFSTRRVDKTYLALVQGQVEPERRTIELPLLSHPKKPGMMIVHTHGKPAVTVIRVVERFHHHTLLEVKPQTGRQHQIRVHLQAIGHPLMVDTLYARTSAFFLSSIKKNYRAKAEAAERPLIQRLTLHAVSLKLTHPSRLDTIAISAPPPKDFSSVLKHLRKHSPQYDSRENLAT